MTEQEQLILDTLKDTLDMVLDKISKPARSNKNGFTNTEKLTEIEALLVNSPYYIVYKDNNCVIYGKNHPQNNAVLVSTHADIVNEITNVSSKCEDNIYHGTYDNLGTNAVATTLMLRNELPDNVFFTFTAEEETGRMSGAASSLKFFKDHYILPFVITLDVTYEGFNKNLLASVEGWNSKAPKLLSDHIRECFLSSEPSQSFCVIKNNKNDSSPFDEEYIEPSLTMTDESFYYRKHDCAEFSYCLPTNGSMHSNYGLDVKEPTFLGYTLILEHFIKEYYLAASKEDREELKHIKEYLLERNKEIHLPVKTYSDYYGSGYSYSNSYYSMFSLTDNDIDTNNITDEDWDAIYSEIVTMAYNYSPLSYYEFVSDIEYIYGDIFSEEELQDIFNFTHEEIDYEEFGYDNDM
jgi:hypothetical protein